MQELNIALFMGGYTQEDVISFKSGKFVLEQLKAKGLKVFPITLNKKGWFAEDGSPVDKNDCSIIHNEKKIKFDVVFNIIHGNPGEDGKLQGYLEMMGIPYTSCDVKVSALTMDKHITKKVLEGIKGMHLAKSVLLEQEDKHSIQHIQDTLSLPLFVKTNSGGSSLGMSKVKTWDELPQAIEKAFEHDDSILIEEFIEGREFTVGVVKLQDKVQALPITEIKAPFEFFDYEAKYTKGATEEITPADLSKESTDYIQRLVEHIYVHLQCKGMVRIDFILKQDKFYLLEVNTIPGQSETSIIPQHVRALGWKESDFYYALLEQTIKDFNA
jgi:D-alanine-D-alanine ligase